MNSEYKKRNQHRGKTLIATTHLYYTTINKVTQIFTSILKLHITT